MKNLSQIWLEQEEKSDAIAIQTLEDYYYKNIIKPYLESEKIIDLHAHTTFSDGELTPVELIRLAIKNRIGTIAITDHDTLNGIKSLKKEDKLIQDSGIQIINGIELSTKSEKGNIHILGYDINLENEDLNYKIEEFRDNATNQTLSIMEQIKRDYGIIFKYKDIKELINSNHNLGRPDLAKLCVKYGYAESVPDAFNKYLVDAFNKIRSVSTKPSYEDSIRLIRKANGIAVLAHPKTLELSEKELLITIRKMIECGLQGIEVYHSTHTKEEVELYLNIAKKYNLLISGGSDYHGPIVKPTIELGKGENDNLNIKELSLVKHINKK